MGIFLITLPKTHTSRMQLRSLQIPPIRFTPMGLNLYYQLTSHSHTQDDPGIFKEHLLMGLAMKALKDYPVIDDSTEIGGLKVFPVDLQGTDNRFRITLQPIPPNEAVNYWSPGKLPIRLAPTIRSPWSCLSRKNPPVGRVGC